jgi:HlyD family secretion protein
MSTLSDLWDNGRSTLSLAKKPVILITILVVFATLALVGYRYYNGRDQMAFQTVPVKRGDLMATISATGTVEPEEVIDVGAQVAGRIVSFGKDKQGKAVDYGSIIEAGMVLAQIDDALYAADVASAKAQLAQTKAGVQKTQADLKQMQAKLFQAERNWARARKLGPSDALSQTDYDAARSDFEVAKANLAVGQAAIVQAKDSVSQATATLKRVQQNLSYCTIVSPVKGIIIDRRVNIGQTVVSSLSAPSLFLIAKDLTRIQIWVSVNEADIGQIRPGQPVTFTVDAHPNEVFKGEVGKVRLNANMTQNVVTYTVEVNTDNSNGKLLPYLTANVKFIVGERHDVLMVPSAALRWTPNPDQIVSGGAPAPKSPVKSSQTDGVVWVPQGSQVRPVPVTLGLSDGNLTEVNSEALKQGTLVALGVQSQQMGPSSASSPFAPKLSSPSKGRGK